MTPQETFTNDSEWNEKNSEPFRFHLDYTSNLEFISQCFRFDFDAASISIWLRFVIIFDFTLRYHPGFTPIACWFRFDFTSILFWFDLCFTAILFWIHVDYLRFSFRFRSYFVWISSGFDLESISISVIYPSANGIDTWSKVWRFVILIHLTTHMILLINHRGKCQCFWCKWCGTLEDCLWHNCWYQEDCGGQVRDQDQCADSEAK